MKKIEQLSMTIYLKNFQIFIIGRLDYNSEGLLLFTDHTPIKDIWNHQI